MSELVCLRCDWTGNGEGSACPACGTPLYRLNSPKPTEPSPNVGVLPSVSAAEVRTPRAVIVAALVAAATTFAFISRDAPEAPALGRITAREAQTGHGTSSTAGTPSPSTAVSSMEFDGCSTKPAPPGRVEPPSEADATTVAAALTADYRFQNSLASSVGDAPDLAEIGHGSSRFANESVRGQMRPVLRFDLGRGLSFPTAELIDSEEFTIELLFASIAWRVIGRSSTSGRPRTTAACTAWTGA